MVFAIQMHGASATNAQKLWMELTLRGFEALANGQTASAARLWLDAAAAQSKPGPFNPLCAAMKSNAGVGNLLIGQATEAKRCFSDAAEAWQRVIAGIETIDVPITGASSSFHFRLAAKDPAVLTAVRRNRYRRLAEAAQTITRFNRSFLSTEEDSGYPDTAKAVLGDLLGQRSPEVRLLATLPGADVDAIYAGKFAALQEYRQPLDSALSQECAQLESAAALTALLSPSLFNKVRHGEGAIANANNSSLNDV